MLLNRTRIFEIVQELDVAKDRTSLINFLTAEKKHHLHLKNDETTLLLHIFIW